jgi:2-methylcitrate dehydratase PrpD
VSSDAVADAAARSPATPAPGRGKLDPAYRIALLDWLACAVGGSKERASRAARALGDGLAERVVAVGTAGHVLDFDDTYLPGLAHLSAPTAPAALVLGAQLGAAVAEVLDAYAAGFEAMAALTAANHPAMRARGWHPTATCGVVGAAVAAARLQRLDAERTSVAVRLALLRAGGLRAGFGSDGKSLQVGMAAAAGVLAARLAEAGASVGREVADGPGGFTQAFQADWVEPGGAVSTPAVRENWIKAYPCCLQTHGAIDAAVRARADGIALEDEVTVTVHPVCLQAASLDDVADGLQAKFSIPYLTAFTLQHGPPTVESFRAVDPRVRALAAERIRVRTDAALLESEAVLEAQGRPVARVEAALGSPALPMDAATLAGKVRALAGGRLDGILDDPERSATSVLAAASLT